MSDAVSPLLDRWAKAQGSEKANYQLFLRDLADLLGVDAPGPTQKDPALDAYVFERTVPMRDLAAAAPGFIDLYKRGCFVLETKQGVDATARVKGTGHGKRGTPAWERALVAAKQQARRPSRRRRAGASGRAQR